MKRLDREAIRRMVGDAGMSPGAAVNGGGSGGSGGSGGQMPDLSGYATMDWVRSLTWWGQSLADGAVQGSIEAGTNGGTLGGFHGIELNTHGSLSGYGGYIDFHYDGSSADYTSRIMEDSSGVLNLNGQVLITSGGNVGIGTTSDSSYKLRVGGSEYLVGGALYLDNNRAIYFKDSNGTMRNAMTVNSSNQLSVGYEFRLRSYTTDIQGGIITFATNNGYSNGVDHRVEAMQIETSGRTWIKQGLRIGDGVILWDSTNNALKVQKQDGTVANLYATGGLSALGMTSGVSSIDAMTFGYLTITNSLNFGGSSNINYDSDDDLLYFTTGSNGFSFTGGYFEVSGPIYAGDQLEVNGSVYIKNNGGLFLGGSRLYLDDTRYIYTSNGHLYFYNGSTTITLA